VLFTAAFGLVPIWILILVPVLLAARVLVAMLGVLALLALTLLTLTLLTLLSLVLVLVHCRIPPCPNSQTGCRVL
jgi:hypothetical protein